MLALLFNELETDILKSGSDNQLSSVLSFMDIGYWYVLRIFSTEGAFNDIRIMLMGADTERVNILMDSQKLSADFISVEFVEKRRLVVGYLSCGNYGD